MNDD
ncbi:Protein of unknown function [Bacillus wiedmannii]|jgi:hypothetical protein